MASNRDNEWVRGLIKRTGAKPKPKKTGLMDIWSKKRTTVIDTPYKKK